MKNDIEIYPQKHHRRSIRLKGYDYTRAGAYFVTICTHNRECLFGNVADGKMILNAFGNIVESEWLRTPEIRLYVELDEYSIMPNHVHGIIIIHENVGAASPLPEMVLLIIGRRGASPLRENRMVRNRDRSGQLSDNSNPLRKNKSTDCAKHQVHRSGNEIIMNTSSAMNPN
jgi:REP element-mobilizing transposase RayT